MILSVFTGQFKFSEITFKITRNLCQKEAITVKILSSSYISIKEIQVNNSLNKVQTYQLL